MMKGKDKQDWRGETTKIMKWEKDIDNLKPNILENSLIRKTVNYMPKSSRVQCDLDRTYRKNNPQFGSYPSSFSDRKSTRPQSQHSPRRLYSSRNSRNSRPPTSQTNKQNPRIISSSRERKFS